MCQTMHAKREFAGSWEATGLHIRVSQSASGLGEGHFCEKWGFRRPLIWIRYAFLGGIIAEASLDVVFDAWCEHLIAHFRCFVLFFVFHWFYKHFQLRGGCINSVERCGGGMWDGQWSTSASAWHVQRCECRFHSGKTMFFGSSGALRRVLKDFEANVKAKMKPKCPY